MHCCTGRATFLREYSWAKIKQCLDGDVDIPTDTCVRDLRVRQAYLARIDEHRSVDFIVGADHDIDQAQGRTQDDAEGARVVPLIGTEVDIERHWRTHLLRRLGSEERRAAAWLLAQAGAAYQQDAAIGY